MDSAVCVRLKRAGEDQSPVERLAHSPSPDVDNWPPISLRTAERCSCWSGVVGRRSERAYAAVARVFSAPLRTSVDASAVAGWCDLT